MKDFGAVLGIGLMVLLYASPVLVGVLLWLWARSTRRYQVCGRCGERVIAEQLDARTCPCCGEPLGPGRRI